MVGIHYEELKLRQQEVEVRALTALVQQDAIKIYKIDAARKLYQIAFPEKIEFDDAYERMIYREQTKLWVIT